ncbi:plasma membrane fusion protein prm1 [Malassezia cuniculi]|uniref:Plasma membrane fusion protein PRM1 n=1 Tax=Malassezia cuniculi TaxID=948313 RepID=A0AAF0J620_9BASI|nr:plasma membrane fusion protein prm1 [Malassezia cuniculi]
MAAPGWYPSVALVLVASAAAVVALVADARAGLALAEHALNTLKEHMSDACADVEQSLAAVLDLPRSAASRAEDQVARTAEAVAHQAGIVLLAALQILSVVLRLVIQTYRSVFLCTLQLLVQTVAAVVDAATRALSDGVHDAARLLREAIRTAIAGGEGMADLAVDSANAVLGIFGQHITPPRIAVPSLSALENVTLPASFVDPLGRLVDRMPNVSTLRSGAEQGLLASLDSFAARANAIIAAELQVAFTSRIGTMLDTLPSLLDLGDIDGMLQRDSIAFADVTNQHIRAAETRLNALLFGWVNETVPHADSALNSILDAVTGTVGDILHDTPIGRPADNFVGCVLGSKIYALEHALEWIQTHLRISLPLVRQDILQPVSAAAFIPERAHTLQCSTH